MISIKNMTALIVFFLASLFLFKNMILLFYIYLQLTIKTFQAIINSIDILPLYPTNLFNVKSLNLIFTLKMKIKVEEKS